MHESLLLLPNTDNVVATYQDARDTQSDNMVHQSRAMLPIATRKLLSMMMLLYTKGNG